MAIMTAAIIIRAAAFIVPRFVVITMMFIVFLVVIILVVIPDLGKFIRTELIVLHVRRDRSCQSRRNHQ